MSHVRECGVLLAVVALALSGCSNNPSRIEYKAGTFYFDGVLGGAKHAGKRQTLSDQFGEDTEALSLIVEKEVILAALRAANIRNRSLSAADVMKIESEWRSASADDSIVTSRIDGPCSALLAKFVASHVKFAEVFVTDRHGLNVCQSQKTTDYEQADEKWWVEASAATQPTHGKLEHDLSADAIGVAIYIPILEPGTQTLMGLAKGLVWREMPK